MIKSMTGYGKAEALLAGRKFMIEMKSVNHRFLEIAVRLPGMFLPLEGEIKKRIGEQFSRGRIEVNLRVEGDGSAEAAGRFTLNLPLVRNYHALLTQLKEELHLGDDITLSMMAGFRDAFVPAESAQDPAVLWEGISTILADAIRTLTEMREKEGESLKRDLVGRLELIAGLLHQPKILFLDEPTIGLDLIGQEKVRDFIYEYNKRFGATILLTSHNMNDLVNLVRRVIVISEGTIIFDGAFEELTNRFAKEKIIKVSLSEEDDIKRIETIGKIKKIAFPEVIISVPRSTCAVAASELLQNFPVNDLTIEEMPIEEVVRKLFRGGVKVRSAKK